MAAERSLRVRGVDPPPASVARRRPAVRGVARAIALAAVVASLAAGCAAGDGRAEGLQVVTTVAPITDLVARVAGDRAHVASIVPAGENSHTYQPRPSEIRLLAQADLFIDNGLGLNDGFGYAASDNLREGVPRVELGDVALASDYLIRGGSLCHFDHCHERASNPHAWTDPEASVLYVGAIAEALTSVDRDGKATYDANAEALVAEIRALDDAIRTAVGTIPQANRKLVVYHDAWSYFARRYGLELIGAIQPIDYSQPSAAEVAEMIDQIQDEAVPAFFGSEVFPTDVMGVVAEQSGATYVPDLADERLPGAPGSPEHSYLGLMRESVRLIVGSLGGDPSALEAFALPAS